MATKTPNIGLHVTPDSDTAKRVLDWRHELTGDHQDSNMMILDSQIKNLKDSKEPVFTKNNAFNKNFGTAAGTVCQGNDARLSNARPASDVYSWAKQANKPAYNAGEVGLGNVNNTADANKSVNYANSAGGAPWDGVSGKPATFPPASHNHNGVYEPVFTKNNAFNKNFGTAAGTVCQGNDSRLADIFDIVIRTQAEFDALIASPNWLGAVSVCFIGNGGTLKFTKSDGSGVKIPPTVKQIQGMNSATIEVTTSSSGFALWYETLPTAGDYWIDSMIVISGITCFFRCNQLTNCVGSSSGNSNHSVFYCCNQLTNCAVNGCVTAFYSCDQLTNCIGTGNLYSFWKCNKLTNCTGSSSINSNVRNSAFWECNQLTNCTGSSSINRNGSAFCDCNQLTNCTGNGGDYCFFNCTNLTNCTVGGDLNVSFFCCDQLTNCTGNSGDYCFYSCNYLNGCKQGYPAPKIAFLGGTNTHADPATVAAT